MPIHGLTDVPKAFLKLGQIRKGERDPQTGAPRDLEYFRVTFHPNEKECEELFRSVYGEKPTSINIRLAFPSVEEVYDANYECYAKGGLIAKASSTQNQTTLQEEIKWIFYRDHQTGEVLVRNCFPVGDAGIEFMQKPIDLTKPVYSYKNRNEEMVDTFLEPVGRLNVVVPELATIRVGYLEFRPTSPKDISAISRELAAIDHMARQAGKDITGIPMKLTRRKEEISKNINGKLSRGPSWLVHIEVGGEWGGKALEYIERKALPEFVDAVAEDVQESSGPSWFDEDPNWEGAPEGEFDPEFLEETKESQSGEPVCTPEFIVAEGIVDNTKHAEALMNLLSITNGAPAQAALDRIGLYNQWREKHPTNNPETRKFCAQKAIAGEKP